MDHPFDAPLARLHHATKRYGQSVALDGVDLELRAGQVLALLGANGAGKTTAISLLLGLAAPDAGEARLSGRDPRELAARQGVGVMLQSGALAPNLKVAEHLDLVRSYYADPLDVATCVEIAGLDGLLGRRYGRLSGGQQRRVQFALAICGRPRVLFLDEPTTGLDIEARQGLWRGLRALVADGTSVLLTTHYLEEAEALADRVVVLAGGRVVAAGSLDEVRARVDQRRIRCVTVLQAAEVARWPGVRSASSEEGRLEVLAGAAEDIVRRLLAADAALSDLDVSRAGLAEAFLEITRDAPLKEAA
ncbi:MULTISPECIES: ABC transporter ATP-binding protein [unclassified Luteimonas]|uniref:ABC transporter ATP-binding protein n=1 Tax=unclassified Luteimonas TaxID=2629088 RepID=UPI0018F0A53C|nr:MULTISPECIES: ABC transporter ATP-binding protein [unclassified Luteimonas]MBJ6978918.1 ABC transporter ATP-binding protein [Luteimonas sp. MC1895]MBJ6984959.1 ABC transporter ATP-binding protein [Luteimonas sp. MC1750]QQO05633.1 ABC transporter ATP-binding protein [Luteimonas sp. MC1750]